MAKSADTLTSELAAAASTAVPTDQIAAAIAKAARKSLDAAPVAEAIRSHVAAAIGAAKGDNPEPDIEAVARVVGDVVLTAVTDEVNRQAPGAMAKAVTVAAPAILTAALRDTERAAADEGERKGTAAEQARAAKEKG